MSQRRFAAIGQRLYLQIARARGLASHRGPSAPLPAHAVDPRVAFVDAEMFTATPWPSDRSGHVSPEWDATDHALVTAAPRRHP